MADGMHLGDEVEVITDKFEALGAPRGAIGVIVDDWTDGSNDVEVADPASGEVLARFRAAEGDVRPHVGLFVAKEPREHGVIFGRGDDLGAPPGDPPSPRGSQFGGMPWGGTTGPWPGTEIPPEDADPPGIIPWELRDEPPSGPILH